METALDEHNRLRSQVAVGSTGSQPPAGDMLELQWDWELARVAQARADSCVFQHECSDCRRVQRFKAAFNISDHWTDFRTYHRSRTYLRTSFRTDYRSRTF